MDAAGPLPATQTPAFAIGPDQAGMSYHIRATWRVWFEHIAGCPVCPVGAVAGLCEDGAVARGEFIAAVSLRPDLADSWPLYETMPAFTSMARDSR